MAQQDSKEKEGNNDKNETIAPKNSETYFELKQGVLCQKDTMVGRVSISDDFVLEMDLKCLQKGSAHWLNILNVAEKGQHEHSSPGLWSHPNGSKLRFHLEDCKGSPCYDKGMELELNKKYHIKFQVINKTLKFFIDGVNHVTKNSVVHIAKYRAPIWISHHGYGAANAIVENLKIYKRYIPMNNPPHSKSLYMFR